MGVSLVSLSLEGFPQLKTAYFASAMILNSDARHIPLKDGSVQCCITSPPYWGLRDYGVDGQLGLEPTPEEYVANMVEVFREVRRALKKDGVVWLNLGDSYASSVSSNGGYSAKSTLQGFTHPNTKGRTANESGSRVALQHNLKPKNLVGIPWRVAFALQADGWWLRSDIVWSKPNPMPESVTDRPTKAHEYVFLLSKDARYFYDADAVKEKSLNAGRTVFYDGTQKNCNSGDGVNNRRTLINSTVTVSENRNLRSVWNIATEPFPEAHFATFPEKLVETCIKGGSRPGDVVFDPFGGGSGRVHKVAFRLGRRAVTTELSFDYCKMAVRQRNGHHPLFAGM
jgi:DNA modification methylase